MTRNLPLTAIGRAILICIGLALTLITHSQPCAPNCRDVNLAILTDMSGSEFHSKVKWGDFIPNIDCILPFEYEVLTTSAARIGGGSVDDIGNEEYLIINDPCSHLDRGVVVMITNEQGACESHLTFKKGSALLGGRSTTVYCTDPIVWDPTVLINGVPPTAVPICSPNPVPARFVADWPALKDCEPGVQDTAKIIYREWEVIDKHGQRSAAFDTINVMRYPQLDATHLYCQDQDTIYCDDVGAAAGPFLIYENPVGSGTCDTVYLIEIESGESGLTFSSPTADRVCDLQVHVDSETFGQGCEEIYRVTVEIKQQCPGGPNEAPCLVPMDNDIEQIDAAGTYWRCSFWLYNLDTLPPTAVCDYSKYGPDKIIQPGDASGFHCFDTPSHPRANDNAPVILVSANDHDCSVVTKLPNICASDDWSGISQVKAQILGEGSFVYRKGDSCATDAYTFSYPNTVSLGFRETPYQVIFELFDSCHNVDTIYCYLLAKDLEKPVAVSPKGVFVNLAAAPADSVAGKKIWVEAATFDEGSWDNCGVSLMLARRTDWYEACMDLCDTTTHICTHHDLEIRKAHLEAGSSVEAHYANEMEWLARDSSICATQLLNGWMFDLAYYGTIECDTTYPLSRDKFVEILQNDTCDIGLSTRQISPFDCPTGPGDLDEIIQQASLIGGGWSKSIPFDCNDACQNVQVELLVMDYWCNWSKTWSDVWVEDQAPIDVVQDVEQGEISCGTYRRATFSVEGEDHPLTLEQIVLLGEQGESAALSALDDIFGTYEKAWLAPSGVYVDAEGIPIGDPITFYDSACVCEDDTIQVKVEDDHLGTYWKDSIYSDCGYDLKEYTFKRGIVSVNCAQNVYCAQTVWSEFDHCGQGVIYRKFNIWQGCSSEEHNFAGAAGSHIPDTITRIQRIYVGNSCELSKQMFDLPEHAEVLSCGIDYDPDGSGNLIGALHPDSLGRPIYRFDDQCRIVGIAHEDKVFKIVGGDAGCYKLIRTWYFADWCGTGTPGDHWWTDRDLVLDTFVQKIIVRDTVPAICVITGPVEDGGLVEAAGCLYNFEARVDVMDACGVIQYYWQLLEEKDGQAFEITAEEGSLDGEVVDQFTVNISDLTDGSYTLKVRITDECQNESYCLYAFNVEALKKPSPVCISSLTAELNPMDLDNDGITDTAMATIWANEFDVSSSAPCGEADEDLRFYIEFIFEDLNPDVSTLDTLVDLDSLNLGCEHMGANLVRLWVLSPSGTADFCDVLLVVTDNNGICPEVEVPVSMVSGAFATADGLAVSGVTVAANTPNLSQDQVTDTSGSYQFIFPTGDDPVTITPKKDGDDSNGVTTADLIIYLGHLIDNSLDGQAHLLISGDINGNGVLGGDDFQILRSLILDEIDELPDVDSWRFARSDYEFMADPVQEILDANLGTSTLPLMTPDIMQDFVAIKMGDADFSRSTTSRSGEPFVFHVPDQLIEAGQSYLVSFRANHLDKLAGFQFNLAYDQNSIAVEQPTEITDIRMKRHHFGLRHLDQGHLLASWVNEGWQIDSEEQLVFQLAFTAKRTGRLSDVIAFSGDRLTSEVYFRDLSRAPLALKLGADKDNIELGQNYPNPWTEVTAIDVLSAENEMGDFEIRDVSGKLIYHERRPITVGKNQFVIEKNRIGARGLYYYTLTTKDFTRTRKMILLD